MNKVLVKLYVPLLEEQYDIWLPLNKRISSIIKLLTRAVNEFSGGYYKPTKMPVLYDRLTAIPYTLSINVKEAGIKNGTEIVLI